MAKVLIVDDEESVRSVLGEMLEINSYQCTLAASVAEAHAFLEKHEFELVISDINMPDQSGLDFIRDITASYPDVAVIMVTGMDDPMIADVALKLGAYDYITKPVQLNKLLISVSNALKRRRLEIDNRLYQKQLEEMVSKQTAALQENEARLKAILEAAEHVSFIMVDQAVNRGCIVEFSRGAECLLGYSRKDVLGRPVSCLHLPDEIVNSCNTYSYASNTGKGFSKRLTLITRSGSSLPVLSTRYPILAADGSLSAVLFVFLDISESINAKAKTQQTVEQLENALKGSIKAMAMAVEMRDPYTSGHQQRVSDLASTIAKEMRLSEKHSEGVMMAGIIHDLGKIAIPAEILSKPGIITETEFELIKIHPRIGYNILKNINFPWPIAQIVLQHHERINGSGYPQGLYGDQILLEARIIGVADVVEAMASHRPYRPARGIDAALKEIDKNKGVLYDSNVVEACINIFDKYNYTFKKVF